MSSKIEEEIFQCIERSNFKQCNEKIALLKRQFPKSAYISTLEIYAKFKQSPTKFDYEKDLGNLYGVNGSLITSDLRALDLLHKLFIELERYEEALHVYEAANFKYTSYELVSQWFEKALEDFHFNHMARSSLQMVKFKEVNPLPSRNYYFWNALCVIALFKFQNDKVTEQESKILPQLAYKNLCNVKPFQSNQELIVFGLLIEELFPNDEEKINELINLIVPQLSKSVDLYLKNFILNFLNDRNPELLFECCKIILKHIDDFEAIKSLLHAAKETAKTKEEALSLIDELVGDSRNSRLARIECDLMFTREVSKKSLLFYLEKNHNKPCCAVDMLHYQEQINQDVLKDVMQNITERDVIHDSNVFKLKLEDVDPIDFYQRHKDSLSEKSKTDYSQSSIFILALVKRVLLKNEPTLDDIILSLSLLENYQMQDPHNYDTKTWIIAIYMHLGLVPLAYSHYLDLKVKNIQNDSMNYLIYTRFSSLFPSKQDDFLNKTFKEDCALYDVSLERVPQFLKISFERKAYCKILGMFEFRSKLERSSSKWMKTCEVLQMSRLCNDKRASLLQKLHQDWGKLALMGSTGWSDNRDWTIFGNDIKNENLPDILDYLKVNDEWISLNCVKEFMIECIPTGKKSSMVDEYLKNLSKDLSLENVLANSLTKAEVWSFKVIYDIYENDGKNLLSFLQDTSIPADSKSGWKLTHTYLMKLSTLKTLDGFKRIKDKETKKLIKEAIKNLRESCDSLYQAYSLKLTAACDALNNSGNSELLKPLGFMPLGVTGLQNSLLTVQKNVRNL